MQLKKWIKYEGICQYDMAQHVKCTPEHLSRILNGKRRASTDLAKRLAIFTKYKVSIEDVLFPDDDNEI